MRPKVMYGYSATDRAWRAPGRVSHPVAGFTPERRLFASDAVWNVSVGAGAQFEAATDPATAQLLTGGPALNAENNSIAYAAAKTSDPLCEVVDEVTGVSYGRFYIPQDIVLNASRYYSGGTVMRDHWGAVLQPRKADGTRTLWDFYHFWPHDTLANTWTCKEKPLDNNVYGHGLNWGRRAAQVALAAGLILPEDIAAGEIPHALFVSIPELMQKHKPVDPTDGLVLYPGGNSKNGNSWVWPAQSSDSSVLYSGLIPLGSAFGIPPSVDVTTLGLSTEGLMVARAIQDYGVFNLATGASVAIYASPAAAALHPTAVARMRADWPRIHQQLRRITNNFPVGVTLTNKVPTQVDGVLGSGVRRRELVPLIQS